jgi:hypothetical protein
VVVDVDVDDEVDVGELEVVVDVAVVVSSSVSVVRDAALEMRLGANELFGVVLDVLVRDGAVVSVGVLGSEVALRDGSLDVVVARRGGRHGIDGRRRTDPSDAEDRRRRR